MDEIFGPTPLEESMGKAIDFMNGLIADLSFRKILGTIDRLKELEIEAFEAGRHMDVTEYQAARKFFENNISTLLVERPGESFPEA